MRLFLHHQRSPISSSLLLSTLVSRSSLAFQCSSLIVQNKMADTPTWTALPRRHMSNRGRNRRLRTDPSTEAHREQPPPSREGAPKGYVESKATTASGTTDDVIPPWKRKNTPGRNSYLKVVLDDETLNRLHGMTERVKAQVAEISFGEEDSKRPLRIRARSLPSLHMTFFFGGEVPCALPTDELVQWHKRLKKRFAQSNFVLQHNDSSSEHLRSDGSQAGTDDNINFSFQIQELAVFPPRRNNLIVAILEASPVWHTLYQDVRCLSSSPDDSIGLHEISKKGKEKWTAHITLANISGGKKSDTKQLSQMLKEFSKEELSEAGQCACNVQCIAMGGPVPSQEDLDWTFEYAGPKDVSVS